MSEAGGGASSPSGAPWKSLWRANRQGRKLVTRRLVGPFSQKYDACSSVV